MFLALGKMDKGSMGSVKGVSKDNMKEYIKSNTQTYVPKRKSGLDIGIDFAKYNNEQSSKKKELINNSVDNTQNSPP